MDPLSEVVKATVATFRLYAKGHPNESHKQWTFQKAAYDVLLKDPLYQTPFELAELAENLKVALRKTPLVEYKQDLARVDLGAFVATSNINLIQWRLALARVLAELVRYRWPSLKKFYPHLF